MSIYIKGLKTPKVGDKFVVEEDSAGNLYLCQENDSLDFYHIISVPSHGRLGDLDELRKIWLKNYRYALTHSILDSLENAPIIIPAEENET